MDMGPLRCGINVVLALLITLGATAAAQSPASNAAGLKIVIIAGEDAINIIQQKTAVAPIVEVRDRNDQPVAGAVVRFAIQGGRASFGGARALTVATDVAGRAVASGLTPTASGALQISASAAFQGQTAAITIAQTNVMTAAQAAAVSSAAGSSGGTVASTGVATGGGGGWLSLTTLGIVGGAVAGGAVVATQVLGAQQAAYGGSFQLQVVQIFRSTLNGNVTTDCTHTLNVAGTMTMALEENSGTVNGELDADWNETEISRTCSGAVGPLHLTLEKEDFSGSAGGFQFNKTFSGNGPGTNNLDVTRTWSFSGALSNGTITGTWTTSFQATGPIPGGATVLQAYPATSTTVTLQKQ